jgi:hypothetical protein
MYKTYENTVAGLVILLIVTVAASVEISSHHRAEAFRAGQESVAKKVIFAYPGTEREVALSHILSKDQALAARAALR